MHAGISKARRYAAASTGAGSTLKDMTIAPVAAELPETGSEGTGAIEKARSPPSNLQRSPLIKVPSRYNGLLSMLQYSMRIGKLTTCAPHLPSARTATS